jgi:RimJ/RimL family protein N-acetyltransferase
LLLAQEAGHDAVLQLLLPAASPELRARLTFDGQPTLRGTLVELRPLRAEDYEELYAVAADPLIWEQHPDRSRHEEARFRIFFAEALASGGALLATDARTRRVIGSSRFHGYSAKRSEVEIGWTFLARSHWGGRYNAELKLLMLRHAFRFVRSVVFFVSPENVRSQRALENIGASLEPEPDAEGRLVYRIAASDFRGDGFPQLETGSG